jgi:hypothetical protein
MNSMNVTVIFLFFFLPCVSLCVSFLLSYVFPSPHLYNTVTKCSIYYTLLETSWLLFESIPCIPHRHIDKTFVLFTAQQNITNTGPQMYNLHLLRRWYSTLLHRIVEGEDVGKFDVPIFWWQHSIVDIVLKCVAFLYEHIYLKVSSSRYTLIPCVSVSCNPHPNSLFSNTLS